MQTAVPLTYFGSPQSPSFITATVNHIYNNATRRLATPKFGPPFFQYQCAYCVADPKIMTMDACWHQRESTQIDHIVPFSSIRNSAMYNRHIQDFINAGVAPFGSVAINWANPQHVQIIYNDLDNLHVVCTAHNSNSHKGSSEIFNTKMMMGIPNLVIHKD